ncbi:MAG: sensor histidine kinase [Sarcina sp.]
MISIIDSKEYEIDLEVIDLKEIFCEVIADFYADFNKISLEPEITIDDDKIFCLGNKKVLKRIIENLTSNLLKYSKSNPIIKLEKEKDNAVITIINKADNISKLDVEKFFDKFYREDKARDLSEKSTGLGLSIVKVLVDKLNGEIFATKEKESIIIKIKFIII